MALMRRSKWLSVFVVVICLCASWWHAYYAPRRDFERLLSGIREINITSLAIEVPRGNTIVLNDAQTVNYLTGRCQRAQRGRFVAGATYYMRVSLSTGGSVKCAVFIPAQTS